MKNELKFEKYTPPGIQFNRQLRACFYGLGAAVVLSLSYLVKYMGAYEKLYTYRMTEKVLTEGAVMTDFHVLIEDGFGCFDAFFIFYLVMCALAVYYYLSYYQGSKSIYLMRRLPDRWELYRRCITLPFVMLVLGIVTQIALWMLYYGIYLSCTPEQCLPVWYQ